MVNLSKGLNHQFLNQKKEKKKEEVWITKTTVAPPWQKPSPPFPPSLTSCSDGHKPPNLSYISAVPCSFPDLLPPSSPPPPPHTSASPDAAPRSRVGRARRPPRGEEDEQPPWRPRRPDRAPHAVQAPPRARGTHHPHGLLSLCWLFVLPPPPPPLDLALLLSVLSVRAWRVWPDLADLRAFRGRSGLGLRLAPFRFFFVEEKKFARIFGCCDLVERTLCVYSPGCKATRFASHRIRCGEMTKLFSVWGPWLLHEVPMFSGCSSSMAEFWQLVELWKKKWVLAGKCLGCYWSSKPIDLCLLPNSHLSRLNSFW